MSTATAPKAPDKMEVLRRLAAGWKVSRIEEELGLSKGALHYWIGKWGIKGVKGEHARQLLDEMLIDQRGEYKAESAADEPDPADGPVSAGQIVQGLKNHELIERLKKELAEKEVQIAELEETVYRLENEARYWAGEAETLNVEVEKYLEERDALLQTVERAVDADPQPPHHDPVSHPAHYTAGKVECIDAIESATVGLTGGLAYNTGAAIKYLWRWSRKGGAEDLRKARWYVDRLIAEVETQCFGS
jgi:hypothetical protein